MARDHQSDFDFVCRVVELLGKQADAEGLAILTAEERVVLLSWWAWGIIGNGGFQFFYEGATNIEEVARAYDTLGLTCVAQACRKSRTLFPNEQPSEDQQLRWAWMDQHQDEADALFDELDPIVWHAEETLVQALVAYIRTHGIRRPTSAL